MKMYVNVSVVIEKGKKCLLVQRSPNSTMSGIWEFPAGNVEIGETLEEAARREVEEETGLKVDKLEYRGYSERVDDRHVLVHHFRALGFSGKVKIRDDEHSEFKWASKSEILKMDQLEKVPTREEREDWDFTGKVSEGTVKYFTLSRV